MQQLRLQHLLWRAGFGPSVTDWADWAALPEKEWWTRLKTSSGAVPEYYDVADNAVKGLLMGADQLGKVEKDDLSKEQKKELRKQSREDLQSLNLHWLEAMIATKAQLREKTALFWHGHFASKNINILYQQQLLQIVRTHALGSFRNLLREVSKSAAMIAFLNNQQNKKQHPNENFAREVMELFTLGRGNYTEDDIKEAARAFTGWSFKLDGSFVFRQRDHDTGSKTVLGKTGNFDGDDIIDLLLAQKQTARFITRKMYRYFVHESNIPDDRIEWLADRFYNNDYQIGRLLDDIFTSDWFYAPENIGNKIKSPVELWVGLRRALPFELDDPKAQLLVQKALGQILFNPPNVAGWPGGKAWIDSSSLMLRLRLPHLVALAANFEVNTKDDDDLQMGERNPARGRQQRLAAQVNWKPVIARFAKTAENDVLPVLARALWQRPVAEPSRKILEAHTDLSSLEKRIQSTYLQLMATPEYQLC